jgi:hypothetical protein
LTKLTIAWLVGPSRQLDSRSLVMR